jgi:hypothetical protein
MNSSSAQATVTEPQQIRVKKRERIESAEAKLERLRMQYRIRQRHHRAKQKERLDRLHHEVYALDQEIHELYNYMDKLVEHQKSRRLQRIWEGNIVQSVKEIFQRFHKGYDSTHESFLREILAENVEVMGIHGKKQVISRLEKLGDFKIQCERLQVLAPEDFVMVLVEGTLEIQGGDQERLFKHVLPSFIRDKADYQGGLALSFKTSFFFDQDGDHGLITKIINEIDYVSSLAKNLLSSPSTRSNPSTDQYSEDTKWKTKRKRELAASTTESRSPLNKLELKFLLS